MKSLQQHGLVAKEPNGNRYMLGPALLKLSQRLPRHPRRARPRDALDPLSSPGAPGCATRLGAELFDEVIIIHHNRRPDGSQQMLETGLTIPAHASAMGKVLLAYDPVAVDEVLAGPLRSLTGETITDLADARSCSSRRSPSAGSRPKQDEAVLGESSIAAPVVDQSGAVIAAVAVVLPSSEWPPDDNVLNDLRETARNISRELGSTVWPPVPASGSREPD